jgi:hypothetical protein
VQGLSQAPQWLVSFTTLVQTPLQRTSPELGHEPQLVGLQGQQSSSQSSGKSSQSALATPLHSGGSTPVPQSRVPPHPSGIVPHCVGWQVVGVQPHWLGVPPPPHV